METLWDHLKMDLNYLWRSICAFLHQRQLLEMVIHFTKYRLQHRGSVCNYTEHSLLTELLVKIYSVLV